MVDNIINCKNCADPVTGKYCSNCGQPITLKRVDGHYLFHEIQHQLHFEKGILYTVKELLIRPGKSVRHFITDDRNRLVKPIVFIIITSLIYSTISHFFHVEDSYVNYKEAKNAAHSAITDVFEWIQHHYGYANIIMGVFIAFWVKLFFRKYQYNFFEILILLCFAMGMGMLIFSVFTIAESLSHVKLMNVAGAIGFLYCAWAIAQFFNGKRALDYVKSLFAYILGWLTAMVFAMLIGVAIDLIVRH